MEDGETTWSGGNSSHSHEAVPMEHGAVKEVLRELLFEIPGFRVLAERGISPEVVATPDPPEGESVSRRSELAVTTAGPPEVAPDPSRLRPNLPDVAGPNPPNAMRSNLPDATSGLGASKIWDR